MRVINLTVNGMIDAAQRGFFDWVQGKDADVIALQNICCREYKIEDDPRFDLPGYERFFYEGEEENFGGTALYVRQMPKAIMRGLAHYNIDRHGTLIQADYEHVSIASVWIPPAYDQELVDIQEEFRETLKSVMSKVRRKRRLFIYAGNLQIAHTSLDLTDPNAHHHTPGFTADERAWLDTITRDIDYRDALREVSAEGGYYSWWPTEDDLGQHDDLGAWRVDYQITSAALGPKVLTASYYTERRFSDHAPLIVDYDIEL